MYVIKSSWLLPCLPKSTYGAITHITKLPVFATSYSLSNINALIILATTQTWLYHNIILKPKIKPYSPYCDLHHDNKFSAHNPHQAYGH